MNKRGRYFRTETIITYLFIIALIGMLAFFIYYINGTFTGFAVYNQANQSEFDLGVYVNTTWNGSAVVLSSGNISGTYTSKIFDAGGDAIWNNLSKINSTSNIEFLFGVDGGGDVYQSADKGVTWIMSKEDYGRTTATEDMFANPDYLFILSSNGNEVWRSADGTDFAVVYNDFNGKSPLVGDFDNNGDLYVITGPGKVWRSTDSGTTWTEQGDFNGDSTNDPKGISIDSNRYIFAVGAAGNVFKSTDSGQNWTKVKDGYGGSTGTDGMEIDSLDNIYILLNKNIYKSIDGGVTWNVINDSFTSYSNNGCEMLVDANDNFFIADCVGRIFESTDFGISWTEIGDMNAEATNNPKGLTEFIKSTNLTYQVKNCSSSDCSDGTWQSVDLDNLNLVGQYFQYQVTYSSPDSSITPQLESVSIDYDLVNSAPMISIIEPQDTLYLINESLNLTYTASDSDGNLDSCWYSLDLGAINISLPGCANTTFNTSEGSHTLYIYANDSAGLEASDNVSFNVDPTGISLGISEPTGTKSSRTGILITYTSIGNNLTCWYNVEFSTGGSVIGNTTLTNCSDSSFDVSADGDYVLYLYVNNTLGASDSANSSFSVDTSSPSPSPSPSVGGSSGGGPALNRIDVSDISSFVAHSGYSKRMSLSIENTGLMFLKNCNVVGNGDYSDWFSKSETKNLVAGEHYDFLFDINIPEIAESGSYNLSIKASCEKISKSVDFVVDIIERKLEFNLIKVEREGKDNVRIFYSLKETSGLEQNVETQFLLFDSNNEKVAEITETKLISANSEQKFEILIPIEESLKGELNLLINLNSETYSTFMQEDIILGSPISGLAILGDRGNVISIILIILFLIFAFFILKRIFKHKKKRRKSST